MPHVNAMLSRQPSIPPAPPVVIPPDVQAPSRDHTSQPAQPSRVLPSASSTNLTNAITATTTSAPPPTTQHDVDGELIPDSIFHHGTARRNATRSLFSILRIHSHRLRIAKTRAQFEHALLTLLTINIVYMYYIDHKLLVLIIRALQLMRLLYFPYSTPNAQRGTAVLLLISNFPVLLIHNILFTGPDIEANVGEMLFINFIGTEPKSLFKVLLVDFIIITLQAVILQCRWDPSAIRILTALPVPISHPLVDIDDDPNIVRSSETTPQFSTQPEPRDDPPDAPTGSNSA